MAENTKVADKPVVVEQPEILRPPTIAPLVAFPIEVVVPEGRQQTPAVGQRATRADGRLHGLGQTKYIDDMYFPNMLFAKIKRAGVASARIKSIDTKEAEAMPGVMAVITGRDIPCNSFGPSLKDQPVLADTRVFHAGDGVAAVAAVTEQIATEALEKIKVEYEMLTPVLDPLESLKLETPGVHAPSANVYGHKLIKKGDVEKAFAESDHIFEGTFRTQMVEHVPLEPHATIAQWDANGRVTLYSTLGRITLGRADISRTLGIPMSRVRVVATVVGGNFGGKNEITTEPALALLSKKTGRPVKCTFTRVEEFIASTTRHPLVMDYKTGRDQAGQDPGTQDTPGARWRRLLLLERNDAGQSVHFVRRTLQHREPVRGSIRRVHEQNDDRGHARIRRSAGLLRLRIAHGRYRDRPEHRSAGDPVAQRIRRRLAEPDQPEAA